MAEQPTDYGTLDTEGQNRSAADNIHEITEASKEMFAAGHQLTENLSELEQRAKRATDLKYQISSRPWLIPIISITAGVVLWRIFTK